MLVTQVVPRLRAAARAIPKVGHEDDEEIAQDATLMATRMMDSAERAGHPVTAGNAAYYAARAARGGRRSYGADSTDALSPGYQLDGRARHEWLDEDIEFESGECGTLHDVLAPRGYHAYHAYHAYHGAEADPAEEAARDRLGIIPHQLSVPPPDRPSGAGGRGHDARGRTRSSLKDSAATNLNRHIVAYLPAFFGEDVIRRLLDGAEPRWDSDLRVPHARQACRIVGGQDTASEKCVENPRSSVSGTPGELPLFYLRRRRPGGRRSKRPSSTPS